MSINNEILRKLALAVPEIQVPSAGIDHRKWSVIACDQHSSEPEYWERVSAIRKNSPSTLDLILPEAYLENESEKRIQDIHARMEEYLSRGVLESKGHGWVYVQRSTSKAEIRQGLVLAIDLEHYDFSPGSTSIIRASEHTIVERIQPRLNIRRNAALELPHIILLLNDAKNSIFNELQGSIKEFEELYNFELMLNGGNLKGYWIEEPARINAIAYSIQQIVESQNADFAYIVGDGNHSLAAAKVLWSECRKELEQSNPRAIESHPLRFALVELMNVQDKGFSLEPIHRCFFNTPTKDFFEFLKKKNIRIEPIPQAHRQALDRSANSALLYTGNFWGLVKNNSQLHIAAFIDELCAQFAEHTEDARIDFIHGYESTKCIIDEGEDRVAFFLKPLEKNAIFSHVSEQGVLPKKSFSIGESEDKRYYFESRKLA